MKHLSIIFLSLLMTANLGSIYAQSSGVSKEPLTFDFTVKETKPPVESVKKEPVMQTETPKVLVARSDVDVNIPVSNHKNERTVAVIIAIENYKYESQVLFAKNDGETFKQYCIQTLGLPEKNISFYPDATLNDIRSAINWLDKVAKAFDGNGNIIFYYAGHGIPDEKSRSSYLLPQDGYSSDVESGYKIDELYARLGALNAKSVVLFLDACFSGAQRGDDMLASVRGVAVRAKQGTPQGNMIVFSAAQGDETAHPYKEQKHGLFTYFLLKKLQETEGNVTFGELDKYIIRNVLEQSILVNKKSQMPVTKPAPAMEDIWQDMKLK